MANPFASEAMAIGYAKSRPPVHQQVVKMALDGRRFERAIDVGCGSGLSTRALAGFAGNRAGFDPSEMMMRVAGSVDPEARFWVGRSERLPVRDDSMDLLTAAGSLNYSDPVAFFREAQRVLKPSGTVLVYDFSPGRHGWFATFIERYPWPVGEALELNPAKLRSMAGASFGMTVAEHFAFGIPLTRDFYIEYMMTESNVACAMRSGATDESVRAWIEETLPKTPEINAEFRGYFCCFVRK